MNKEEEIFLSSLTHLCSYWANLPTERLYKSPNETENEARLNGLIHSILVMMRGDSSVNDFRIYTLKSGRNYIGRNEYLPSRYFEIFKKYNSKGEEDE